MLSFFFIKRNILLLGLSVIVLFDALLFVGQYLEKNKNGQPQEQQSKGTKYEEIQEYNFSAASFPQLETYFRDLARRKGAAYAYEVLKVAPIKPGIDMHLLGHVVGEELYKQKGFEGITLCTEDFRNACSHTIVVGLLMDHGEEALHKIAQACKLAPGGKSAYPLCYHGLGHGVLAYVGYELPKAVELCKKTGSSLSGPEFPECVGGAIMEIDSGGFHDRQLWQKESKKYVRADDPLYPCNDDLIPAEAKKLCYIYLSPHLLKIAGNFSGIPTSEQIQKAFNYCSVLASNDPNRDTCFGGFGKEFVVLAKARDIRNIDKMTDDELAQVDTWCSLAKEKREKHACDKHGLNSLYWGGQYGFNGAIRYCKLLEDKKDQQPCYTYIINLVLHDTSDVEQKIIFCQALPDTYKKQCQERL